MKSICPYNSRRWCSPSADLCAPTMADTSSAHTPIVLCALCGLVKNLTCRKGLHYCDYCNKKEAQVILSSPRCVVIQADSASCPLLGRAKELSLFLLCAWMVRRAANIHPFGACMLGKRKVERREKRATMSLFSFLDVRDAIFIFVGP